MLYFLGNETNFTQSQITEKSVFFDSEPNLTKSDTNFFIFDTFSVTYFAPSLVKHSIDH